MKRLGLGWVRAITSQTGKAIPGMKEVAAGVWIPSAGRGSDQMAAKGKSDIFHNENTAFYFLTTCIVTRRLSVMLSF